MSCIHADADTHTPLYRRLRPGLVREHVPLWRVGHVSASKRRVRRAGRKAGIWKRKDILVLQKPASLLLFIFGGGKLGRAGVRRQGLERIERHPLAYREASASVSRYPVEISAGPRLGQGVCGDVACVLLLPMLTWHGNCCQ